MDLNSVSVIGNLTKDVEFKTTEAGVQIANFSIAVNGLKKDDVDFFDVTAFKGTAEACSKYLRKGLKVAIAGRLNQQRWKTESGDNRSRVKIIAQQVQFLTPKAEDAADAGGATMTDIANQGGAWDGSNSPF